MIISSVTPQDDFTLFIKTNDGQKGVFDVTPYLKDEAFLELKEMSAFKDITNGGYFVEWNCGADLSADTIDAHLVVSAPIQLNSL